MTWHGDVTKNHVGTDTVMIGAVTGYAVNAKVASSRRSGCHRICWSAG